MIPILLASVVSLAVGGAAGYVVGHDRGRVVGLGLAATAAAHVAATRRHLDEAADVGRIVLRSGSPVLASISQARATLAAAARVLDVDPWSSSETKEDP